MSKSETILKYKCPNYKNVLNFCFAFGEAIRIDSSTSPPCFLSKAESVASVGMTIVGRQRMTLMFHTAADGNHLFVVILSRPPKEAVVESLPRRRPGDLDACHMTHSITPTQHSAASVLDPPGSTAPSRKQPGSGFADASRRNDVNHGEASNIKPPNLQTSELRPRGGQCQLCHGRMADLSHHHSVIIAVVDVQIICGFDRPHAPTTICHVHPTCLPHPTRRSRL